MKRTIYLKLSIIFLLVIFIASDSSARRYWGRHRSKSTTIKIGYFNPKDTKEGALLGINLSGAVDEIVDLGFSVDIFQRTYKKDSEVAKTVSQGGLVEHQIQRDMEFTTTALPLMGTVTIKLSGRMPFTYFLDGGLGYALMWNKESNYSLDVSEKRFYHGVVWQLGLGMMYKMGSRSYLIAEAFYNDASLKRDKGKTENGLPIWTEVDLSGPGFRLGLRFER